MAYGFVLDFLKWLDENDMGEYADEIEEIDDNHQLSERTLSLMRDAMSKSVDEDLLTDIVLSADRDAGRPNGFTKAGIDDGAKRDYRKGKRGW